MTSRPMTRIEVTGEPRRILEDGQWVTFIPITLKKRGHRTVLAPPEGSPTPPRQILDIPLLKALGKALYWQRRLDTQEMPDAAAIAKAEGLDKTWVNETLRLALLAPDIVEAILQGKQPVTLTLQAVRQGVPACWAEQRRLFEFEAPVGPK